MKFWSFCDSTSSRVKNELKMIELLTERLESKITPRFRVEETGCIIVLPVMVSAGLCILAICAGRPMKRNSVLARS